MEQNDSQKSAAGNSCAQSDRRTFLIAFLTAVIVLAVYHFGIGIFAIFSGKSDYCTIPVTREYVLVPVSSLPHPHMGMMGGRGPGFRHRGEHNGEHGGMHRFGKHGGMHRHGEHGGHHTDAQVKTDPPAADNTAAPAAPDAQVKTDPPAADTAAAATPAAKPAAAE